jgi:hypothetical protein
MPPAPEPVDVPHMCDAEFVPIVCAPAVHVTASKSIAVTTRGDKGQPLCTKEGKFSFLDAGNASILFMSSQGQAISIVISSISNSLNKFNIYCQ